MTVSADKIDDYTWKVQRYLMYKYGCDEAVEAIYPLRWYIYTGRASTDFLRQMQTFKPYIIGRMLYANKDKPVDKVTEIIRKKVLKMC